jgi:8-oxo-dGTP diphosphatase
LLKVCVAGILARDDKILLGKRSADLTFYPNVWDIIGGHSKENETPEQTLSRELREEIGVIPTSFVRIAMLHDPETGIHGDYEYNIYLVTDWTGSPRNLAINEHSELRWVTIHEALTLNLAHPEYPNLFRNIEKYMARK